MRNRIALRAAAVLTGALLPLVAAAPALALGDGEIPAHEGIWKTLGLFVATPLLAFLLICALVVLPGMLRAPRYRPGKPWHHDPLWFGGPDDPAQALSGARPGATSKGGASAEW